MSSTATSPWHLSRGWGPDPFAPECGCEVAPCGYVIDGPSNQGCPQHSLAGMKSIRSAHREKFCKVEPPLENGSSKVQ